MTTDVNPMTTVLVVDDHPLNRKAMSSVLAHAGYRILEAGDGSEGFEIARQQRPDLAIVDILMPIMDGYEMVRAIRSDPGICRTPVILYSSTFSEGESQSLARSYGVQGLLSKPFKRGDVLELVSQALKSAVDPVPVFANPGAVEAEKARVLTAKLSEKIAELEESLAQHSVLSKRLVKVREEERTRIAREIHDDLGQTLSVLNVDLDYVQHNVPRRFRKIHARIELMQSVIERTIRTVQRIAMDLRPGHLDELGLGAAIDWQLREFGQRTGIRIHSVQVEDIAGLTNDQATGLFRVFQEALTNIIRHAKASSVEVQLRIHNGCVVLKLADDGVGITPGQIADRNSIGLLGMTERIQSLGGELSISNRAGSGTELTASIPLRLDAQTN